MTTRQKFTSEALKSAGKKSQTDLDKAYRARQRALGIVRKTVRVPADRWPEVQAIVAQMRKEADITEGIRDGDADKERNNAE